MEKITNKSIEDFPPSTLYLDDLTEIVEVLSKNCKQIEVKIGNYKITDPTEFETLVSKFSNERLGDIYLQGYNPYISINLKTYGISVYISEDSLEQLGIVAKIRNIVNKGNKRKPGLLFKILSFVELFVGVWQIISKEYLLGILLIFAAITLIPAEVNYNMRNTLIVYNHPRRNTSNFFKRKKDEILLAVISAALGGFIMYFITKLLP